MVVLGSSSSGNSTLVEVDGASVLVDAGFSCREITRRMSSVGADPRELRAIIVTHEHTDHVRGVPVLARSYDLPVFATAGTLRAAAPAMRGLRLKAMALGQPFGAGPFRATLVPIPHDAAEPAAVRLEANGRRLLVATDIGQFPFSLVEHAQDMDALVLESNHDEVMLRTGPYPEFLKRRIRGPMGHLSNVESATALRSLLGPRTRNVLLAHLSQRNNTEELALKTVLGGLPGPMRAGVEIRTTSPHRSEAVEL